MSKVVDGQKRRLVIVLTALVLLAASCGSSDDGSDPGDTTIQLSDDSSSAEGLDAESAPGDTANTSAAATGSTSSVDEPIGSTTSSSDEVSAGSTQPQDTTSSTTTGVEPDQPLLPELCNRDLLIPVLPAELTFTADSGLFSVGFDGEFECLLVVEDGIEIATWGAQADKVLFVDGSIMTVANNGKESDSVPRRSVAFSRPTGFNYVWVADDAIQKSRIDGEQLRTLELGVPVSEVVYHPDGAHLLSVTADPVFGGSSIYVSDNEGLDGVPLIFSDDATITDLNVTADGSKVVFVAAHADGTRHVHLLDLAAATEAIPNEADEDELLLSPSTEQGVVTLHEAAVPLNGLVLNSDGTRAAIAEGTCESGSTIEWLDLESGGYATAVLPNLSIRPVGFTTESTLAVMAYDANCDAGGDLYLVDLHTGSSSLVRADVDSATIRRIDATARYSLVDVTITGFAG
ncbi:MAG: hypothetical protein GXP35_18850 [Actinobacteria bacterium]|nr:hypothetical protein [Actinomycetota bacterium]